MCGWFAFNSGLMAEKGEPKKRQNAGRTVLGTFHAFPRSARSTGASAAWNLTKITRIQGRARLCGSEVVEIRRHHGKRPSEVSSWCSSMPLPLSRCRSRTWKRRSRLAYCRLPFSRWRFRLALCRFQRRYCSALSRVRAGQLSKRRKERALPPGNSAAATHRSQTAMPHPAFPPLP